MYTAPVPPVRMFSVLPVKLGVPVAEGVGDDAARGALHAVATSSAMTSGAPERTTFLICPPPRERADTTPAAASSGATAAPRPRPSGAARQRSRPSAVAADRL